MRATTMSNPQPSKPGANKSVTSTPVAQTPSISPQTGTWRHPRFDEIVRRQNASTFTDRNLKQVIYNVCGWLVLWVLGRMLWRWFPKLLAHGGSLDPHAIYTFHGLQIIFAYNIAIVLSPLIRPKDDLSDIPLTPAQRKLLGLAPTSNPPTPGSHYSTPPRFARTPTSLSGSPASRPSDGSRGSFSNSPLSRKGSPLFGNSEFSPNASPLLQKAVDGSRMLSYGSPSPLSISKTGGPDPPGTPSPIGQKSASVGLSQKWLYEKRRNSGNSRIFP